MTFYKQFDNKTRFMVIYQEVTQTATRIAKIQKISQTTVYNWIRTIEQDVGIFQVATSRGSKQRIPENLKKQVLDKANEQPGTVSTRRLGKEEGISKSTIHRVLRKEEFTFEPIEKAQHELTVKEKQDRVLYRKKMLARKEVPLENTFFSDKMGIKLKHTHQKKVWTPKNKKVKLDIQKEKTKLN